MSISLQRGFALGKLPDRLAQTDQTGWPCLSQRLKAAVTILKRQWLKTAKDCFLQILQRIVRPVGPCRGDGRSVLYRLRSSSQATRGLFLGFCIRPGKKEGTCWMMHGHHRLFARRDTHVLTYHWSKQVTRSCSAQRRWQRSALVLQGKKTMSKENVYSVCLQQ